MTKDRKQYYKDYNAKNAEKRKQYVAKWKEQHPGYHTDYMARYREKNREALRIYQKEWREANKEKLVAYRAARRAAKKAERGETAVVLPPPLKKVRTVKQITVQRDTEKASLWANIKAKFLAYRSSLGGVR